MTTESPERHEALAAPLRTPVCTDPRNRFEIIDAEGYSIGSGTTPTNTDAIVAACNAMYAPQESAGDVAELIVFVSRKSEAASLFASTAHDVELFMRVIAALRTLAAVRAERDMLERGTSAAVRIVEKAESELSTLRAQVEQMREALRDLCGNDDAGEYETEYDGRMVGMCIGCDRQDDVGRDHGEDCPYRKGRALISLKAAP